jgi:hypothetical protein
MFRILDKIFKILDNLENLFSVFYTKDYLFFLKNCKNEELLKEYIFLKRNYFIIELEQNIFRCDMSDDYFEHIKAKKLYVLRDKLKFFYDLTYEDIRTILNLKKFDKLKFSFLAIIILTFITSIL